MKVAVAGKEPPENVDIIRVKFSVDDIAGIFLPLVTCSKEAEKSVMSHRGECEGTKLFPLAVDAVEGLLIGLKADLITHVNFNPDQRRANPVPIDKVIAHFGSLRG